MASYTVQLTVFLIVIVTAESRSKCDLNCGPDEKCVVRRSTCEYPPCPKFPVCEAMSEEEIAEESHVVHPGSCPAPLLFGQCKEKCDVDGDCEEDEKCCRNLCGRTCTKIENVVKTKPGTCPRNLRNELTCTVDCMSDLDCPGTDKCCRTSCGSTCTKPCYYWLRRMNYAGARSGFWTLPYICRI